MLPMMQQVPGGMPVHPSLHHAPIRPTHARGGSPAPAHGHPPLPLSPTLAPLPRTMMPEIINFPINFVPPPDFSLGRCFSVDVECVATGPRHDDRGIAQIALVDQHEHVLLNLYIKQTGKVFSYLPDLTGLTKEKLDKGIPLDNALKILTAALPSNCILVGQNILKDVQWLGLVEGTHFREMRDLAGLYRAYNAQYGNYSMYSLHHKAKYLLNFKQVEPHDAAIDATMSIRLFNLHTLLTKHPNPAVLQSALQVLTSSKCETSFAKRNPVYDGVCMGAKKTCTCGAPFFF